jgi:hypothetical protein
MILEFAENNNYKTIKVDLINLKTSKFVLTNISISLFLQALGPTPPSLQFQLLATLMSHDISLSSTDMGARMVR